MGVLKCDRFACTNIMCDRLSQEYGYICNECFEELVKLGPMANVAEFMQSQKKNTELLDRAARARFNEEFPLT